MTDPVTPEPDYEALMADAELHNWGDNPVDYELPGALVVAISVLVRERDAAREESARLAAVIEKAQRRAVQIMHADAKSTARTLGMDLRDILASLPDDVRSSHYYSGVFPEIPYAERERLTVVYILAARDAAKWDEGYEAGTADEQAPRDSAPQVTVKPYRREVDRG